MAEEEFGEISFLLQSIFIYKKVVVVVVRWITGISGLFQHYQVIGSRAKNLWIIMWKAYGQIISLTEKAGIF